MCRKRNLVFVHSASHPIYCVILLLASLQRSHINSSFAPKSPNLLVILIVLDVTGTDVLPLALWFVSRCSLCTLSIREWLERVRVCCVAGCTYALVEVIPNAVRNGVVGTVCAVNCRSSLISSVVYPRGREAYSSKAKAEMKTVPRNT